jgi:hypothetical protein
MIQAKELRIGNYAINDGDDSIMCITAQDIFTLSKDEDWLNPIPLTHEILLNCGFEKINSYWVNKRNIDCHIVLIDALTRYMVSVTGPFGMVTLKSINSVHQLQNLYYALSGEELIYKP